MIKYLLAIQTTAFLGFWVGLTAVLAVAENVWVALAIFCIGTALGFFFPMVIEILLNETIKKFLRSVKLGRLILLKQIQKNRSLRGRRSRAGRFVERYGAWALFLFALMPIPLAGWIIPFVWLKTKPSHGITAMFVGNLLKSIIVVFLSYSF